MTEAARALRRPRNNRAVRSPDFDHDHGLRPAGLPPQARLHRSAPDDRVRRPGRQPLDRDHDRLEHQEIRPHRPFVHSRGGRAGDQLAARIRRIWRTGARALWPLMKWPSPRAASGLARAGQSRAASARGSLGTLCPRLPRLLTYLRGFGPGWPGRGSMAETREVRGVGWRDPVARPCACGGGQRASVPA